MGDLFAHALVGKNRFRFEHAFSVVKKKINPAGERSEFIARLGDRLAGLARQGHRKPGFSFLYKLFKPEDGGEALL